MVTNCRKTIRLFETKQKGTAFSFNMNCIVSKVLPRTPVVPANPNIPFEVYLNLISPVWYPRQLMHCPPQRNVTLHSRPLIYNPLNLMTDAGQFKSDSTPFRPPLPYIIRDKPPQIGILSTPNTMKTKTKFENCNNVGKYKCRHCGRCFSRSNTLVSHERIHTGEKPFNCGVCHQKFRQYGNLVRHQIVHTNLKPFSCQVCKRAFNRKSNLKTHIQIHCRNK